MFHSCHIKFGAVTNLTDARYAAAAYAKWTGFCLDPSNPRYISPLRVKEITGWIAGSEIVAEIGGLLPVEMAPALELLGFSWVQVNSEAVANLWKDKGYKVILEGVTGNTELFSLDTSASGIPQSIVDITEWTLSDIKKLAETPPFGINLNGGDETAPGIRDFAEVDEILGFFEIQ